MKTLKNIWFIMRFVWGKSKLSILILLVPAFSSLLVSVINVWGFRNIVQSLENGGDIGEFIFWISVFLLLNVLSDFLYSIHQNFLMPNTGIILNREINIELMQKAAKLDIKCFDDAMDRLH